MEKKRNDIFRVMDSDIYANGKRDIRSREYLFPRRVMWTKGCVKHAEELLKEKPLQSTLTAQQYCTLKNSEEEKASVLLDFGVELHGGIQLIALNEKSEKGAKVHIRFGESVSEAMSELGMGTNATNDHAVRDMVAEIGFMSMTPVGETGFRFVRIDLEDDDAVLTLKSVCAVFVFKDVPYYGSFSCSDPLLTRIWDVGAYTVHLNMQEYIWDGIKRDRLVWQGDMHPEARAIYAAFGADDSIPDSLNFNRMQTKQPEWINDYATYSMWFVIVVHDYYQFTGNVAFLEQQREFLAEILDQLSAHIDENGRNIAQVGKQTRFLDWPSVGKTNVVDAGVQSIHVLALKSLIAIFGILGDENRVKQCEEDIERLKKFSLNYEESKQAAALMVIAGLEDAVKANENLLKVGGAKGMSTFMGYYILTARAMAGDYAGCLDTIRDYWGGMLQLGATTFWEDFDVEWLKNAGRIDELPKEGEIDVHAMYGGYCYKGLRHSLCHGWAGGVTPWISENVLGVQIKEAGCKTVEVRPHLGDLQWVKGKYPTPYGAISISCQRMEDGTLKTDIDAPKEVKIIL